MTQYNTECKDLLQEWYTECYANSSPYSIKQKYDRAKTEFVYNILKQKFAPKYFNIKQKITPIEKTNWLYVLLANKNDIDSFAALFDVAELIEFLYTLDDGIIKEFKEPRLNPQNLRTFLFEIYIYRLFYNNNISFKAKPLIGKQPLDGTCEILESIYLVECRKVYLPKVDELDVKYNVASEFYLRLSKIPFPKQMICNMLFIRPIVPSSKSEFQSIFKFFFKYYENINEDEKICFKEAGNTVMLTAVKYSPDNFIEESELKPNDIIFTVKHNLDSLGKTVYGEIGCKFNHAFVHSLIPKKIETILKEKKNQHKNSTYQNKIIFIDSEVIPELQMSLFQLKSNLNIEEISKIQEKLKFDAIICIVRRFYEGGVAKRELYFSYEERHNKEVYHTTGHFERRGVKIIP